MADINSGSRRRRAASAEGSVANTGGSVAGGLTLTAGASFDDGLLRLVEMLFFAYRDFTGEADAVLQDFGFGRAHHRVLHFVNRRPGLRVADLLDILRITKQSLARVLKQLVDRGFIAQAAGPNDRRERRLYLTPSGKALALQLAQLQMSQIARAIDAAGGGGEGRAHIERFLLAMIGPEQHGMVEADADANDGAAASPAEGGAVSAQGNVLPRSEASQN